MNSATLHGLYDFPCDSNFYVKKLIDLFDTSYKRKISQNGAHATYSVSEQQIHLPLFFTL